MLYRTKAEDAHVEYMAPRLRRADMDEIQAYSGLTPQQGLALSKASSTLAYSIIHDSRPIIMYGGTYEGNGKANIWMLATDEISKNSMSILRHSKQYTDMLHHELDSSMLYAFADARNTLHQVWLSYIGFKKGPVLQVRNTPFITVTRLKCV